MGNRQGSLFESTLFDMMNAKPFNPDAFLAGHKQATLKRLESQASRCSAKKSNTTPNGNLTQDLSVA